MITIAYIDDDNCTVSGDEVWQYDYGQKVTITGLPSLPTEDTTQVHFATSKTGGTAYAVEAEVQGTNVVADVPDLILRSGVGVIWLFVFVCNADEGETVYRVHFPVTRRPQPNIYNEDKAYEHMFARTIAKVTAAASEASEAVEEAQEVLDSIPSDYTELSRRVLALYPTETASGDVVAFDDGADNIPVKSLSVAIEPVQDLHGYDVPWPAGGGKNLLKNNGTSGSNGGITWAMNADGSISLSGTSGENYVHIIINALNNYQKLGTGSVSLVCSANASYNPSIVGARGINFQNDIYVDGTYASTIQAGGNTQTYSGEKIEVRTSRLRIAPNTTIPNGTIFYPAIEIGNTISPTWTPYSNICPISGWDAVEVYRTGVNVWDEEWEQGTIRLDNDVSYPAQNAICSKNFCAIVPGQSYYVTCNKTDGGSQNRYYMLIVFYDAEQAFISAQYCNNTVVSAPVNARYFKIATNTSTVVYGSTYNHDISINYPSTDHDYHAYDGHVYPISLTQAGTVYGGTLNVTSGVLTVTHGFIASYAGESLPGAWISDRDVYAAGTAPTMGAQVCYVLAIPLTYNLTPTEITTLLGNNTVWSDAGDVSVTYRADLQKYFEA